MRLRPSKRHTKHSVLTLLAWTVVACGPSLDDPSTTSIETPAPPTDRPNEMMKASNGGAGKDSFCSRARAADPTITRCIDHDEATSQVAPLFGFDGVTTHADDPMRIVELAPSPSTTAGQSLRLGFDAARIRHDVLAYVPAADAQEYRSIKSMSLDVDVTVDSMATSYAGLAMFELGADSSRGSSCQDILGFAVNEGSFVRVEEPGGDVLMPFRMGETYHLRVVARPNEQQSREDLFINGVQVSSFRHFYPEECNVARSVVGTFYAQGGTISARFDQLVLRVVK